MDITDINSRLGLYGLINYIITILERQPGVIVIIFIMDIILTMELNGISIGMAIDQHIMLILPQYIDTICISLLQQFMSIHQE